MSNYLKLLEDVYEYLMTLLYCDYTENELHEAVCLRFL